jgi:L-threonylcarbamoyladenylate synthase
MTETGPTVLTASDPDAILAAVLAMQAGGIVGIPTETVYGIGVVPRPEALAALIRAKQRPEEKGIALIIDGLEQVEGLVEVSLPARRLAERCWPGPLTLVLPLRNPESVPAAVSGGRDTLGLRVPDHPVPRALARTLGPIAVTSANRSGAAPATTAAQLLEAVGSSLALVLDDGPVRGRVPSTVVAVDAAGAWTILRQGALATDVIATVAGQG